MRTTVLSHFSWSLCLVALTHLGGCGQGIGDGSELDIGSSKDAPEFETRMPEPAVGAFKLVATLRSGG